MSGDSWEEDSGSLSSGVEGVEQAKEPGEGDIRGTEQHHGVGMRQSYRQSIEETGASPTRTDIHLPPRLAISLTLVPRSLSSWTATRPRKGGFHHPSPASPHNAKIDPIFPSLLLLLFEKAGFALERAPWR
jgi:hypothetical protein